MSRWLAYEELPWPTHWSTLTPQASCEEVADFLFLAAAMNFAFTDFQSGEIFRTRHEDKLYSDSDAMMACWRLAFETGKPILEGAYLREMNRDELAGIFGGSIEMPLLDERVRILREIGGQLRKPPPDASTAGWRRHRAGSTRRGEGFSSSL